LKDNNKVIIIGYSGHAYVVLDCLLSSGQEVIGYCDKEQKTENPFKLTYLGNEHEESIIKEIKNCNCFIGIGNNQIREKVFKMLESRGINNFINAVHPSAVVSKYSDIGNSVLIASNATINALATIGNGVICNSSSTIEHECKIGNFTHIAPGATLAGNVEIGARSFIGANAVIKQGTKIGNDVLVGAGSVVIKDIPNGLTVVGNPTRILNKK